MDAFTTDGRATHRRAARRLAALALGALLAAAAAPAAAQAPDAQPPAPCELPSGNLDGLQLMRRAAACLGDRRMLDAGKLYYAGSIRLRTVAALDTELDRLPALMGSIQNDLGEPINRWLGGDARDYLAAMDWALAWDARTNFPDLPETLKELHLPGAQARAKYQVVRDGLAQLRVSVARDPAAGYRTRRENGLDVRDPRFDARTGRLRAGA